MLRGIVTNNNVHYHHPTTSIKFSEETTPSEIYRSHYGTPQQTTSVQSASETSIYDNVDIDDDPITSEQQTDHPYVNVKYDVQQQIQALLCHSLIIIHVTHVVNNFN